MISLEKTTLTEPPLIKALTDEQIQKIKEEPLVVKKYKNHTQC